MAKTMVSGLAIAATSLLISVLAYGSQILFYYIEPGPVAGQEHWSFNLLVCCLWTCYFRACLVDPGTVPIQPYRKKSEGGAVYKGLRTMESRDGHLQTDHEEQMNTEVGWCMKCQRWKPPRAHHCKICKKCVLKMDHHCPWTANCVSYRTFPHFMRFLFFAVAAMCQLAQFLFARIKVVWDTRHLPSYLGPSGSQLGALFVLFALNCITLFAVGIIFLRTVYSLATNVTAIESWEIERHEALVRRARKRGGYLDGPNGTKIRIVKQEFPYDIGIWSNICQGMNGGPLVWFWPFARTPSVESGLDFEVNDFEEPDVYWPPPDPDRMYRKKSNLPTSVTALDFDADITDEERVRRFKERQEADLRRRTTRSDTWKNFDGEKLEDYGVDEDAEIMGNYANVPAVTRL